MTLLTSPSQYVSFTLGEATVSTEIDVTAHYVDTQASLNQTPSSPATACLFGTNTVSSNGTGAVIAVGGPVAGIQRAIHGVVFFNRDTVTHTTIVSFYDGTTLRRHHYVTLKPNARWVYR